MFPKSIFDNMATALLFWTNTQMKFQDNETSKFHFLEIQDIEPNMWLENEQNYIVEF